VTQRDPCNNAEENPYSQVALKKAYLLVFALTADFTLCGHITRWPRYGIVLN
jgi:hypothetical protein